MSRIVPGKSGIFIILIAISIGLISLGVRLPTLAGISSSPGKPKPRPRAIIQHSIKSCKVTTATAAPMLATIDTVTVICLPAARDLLHPVVPVAFHHPIAATKLSRAPPA
jgi:hypothetical protein